VHLAIFGCTGLTGRALVSQAMEQRHDVTAGAGLVLLARARSVERRTTALPAEFYRVHLAVDGFDDAEPTASLGCARPWVAPRRARHRGRKETRHEPHAHRPCHWRRDRLRRPLRTTAIARRTAVPDAPKRQVASKADLVAASRAASCGMARGDPQAGRVSRARG
jgi:hypothetical protein